MTVRHIFPADDFDRVCKNAARDMEFGLILGWDKDTGEFICYGGGTDNGRRPVAKDWLWLAELFKNKLINGDFS